MDALTLLLRFPFYSTKRRSYQVRSTFLLPPPSTLKGALAKGLILLKGTKGKTLDSIVKKAIENLEEKLLYVGIKPHKSTIIKNPILLKRLRNLETKSKPEKSDAMRREYTFTRELLAIYVYDELSDQQKHLYRKAALLIDQLGDTESIGNVIDVVWKKPVKETVPLNIYAKLDDFSIENGQFRIDRMRETPDFGENVEEKPFFIPMKEKRYKRTVYYSELKNSPVKGNYKLKVFNEEVGLWI